MDVSRTNLLHKPSKEQAEIITAALEGKNLICDSTAGSGKTSTILHIAVSFSQQFENKKILQITYNTRLKEEVRSKVKQLNLLNIDVHSYHALNLKYYGGHLDNDIINTVNFNKPLKKHDHFDLIIVDETQDMTPVYYSLLQKYIEDSISYIGGAQRCFWELFFLSIPLREDQYSG